MIYIKNLNLQFGKQIIFDDISFAITKSDRIGLVGRNGTGKSTLLKIIAQQASFDSGILEIQKGIKIAYMPQEVVIISTKNVLDETLTVFEDLFKLAQEKDILSEKIHHHPTEHDMLRYSEIEHTLLEQEFDNKKVRAQKILAGLGFDEDKQTLQVSQLSVGWRMRVVLAKLLIQDADFYLFDEPTNHLDLSTKNWFLHFLQNGSFGYLLVCHDRYFLDKACNKTFELSLSNLNVFHGNYSYFVEQKEIRTQHLQQAYLQQQREIKQKEKTINRFRASATKAAMAQSMIKALDKIERIELEPEPKTMNLKLTPPPRSGQHVLKVHNVAHAFNRQLFHHVSFEINRGDKVALIAPNGTGKTTLFNLIAGKLSLQHGSIDFGHNVTTALFDQDQEKVLDPEKTILQEVTDACPNITESQIRAILGAFLFSGDDVFKKTKVLSGGERNRVAMSKIILSKANLFLLDEPTNHLDIQSKEIILKALQNFEGTILFVSHDQDFVNKLATKIIELNQNGVGIYFGNYENYVDTKETIQDLRKDNKQDSIISQNSAKNNQKNNYALQKKSKNLENKINNLEQEIPVILTKISIARYGSEQYTKLNVELKNKQQELTESTKEWEQLQLQIEKEAK